MVNACPTPGFDPRHCKKISRQQSLGSMERLDKKEVSLEKRSEIRIPTSFQGAYLVNQLKIMLERPCKYRSAGKEVLRE